jgi:uncharacterized protein HI_0926
MEYILYFAETCPDTAPFKEKLSELGITYKEVEVMTSLKNFKEFLFVRDTYSQFEGIRGNMKIGIPCLVVSKDECILDISELARLKK